MTSFFGCFFFVSMVVLLPFLLGSSSTIPSTKYIDTICNNNSINNKAFCLQTLAAYPPAVSATDMANLVKIAVGLGVSHANKTTGFIAELAKDPTFKRHFKVCNESYTRIVSGLRIAIEEIDVDAMSANYDVMICYDQTQIVRDEVGKNTDKASKRLIEMTLLMENFIDIGNGATTSVPWRNY